MIYKFYKAQVTGTGYLPQGHCQATLELDDSRNPTWTDLSEEFERLCMPYFENSVRMGVLDHLAPLKPYSKEALENLSKRQLPSQGFMMVEIKEPPKTPPSFSFNAQFPTFSPPPGIMKPPPKTPDPE